MSSSSSNDSPQRSRNHKKTIFLIIILILVGSALLYFDKVKRIVIHQKIQVLWNDYGTIDLDSIESNEEYDFLPVNFINSLNKIKVNISRYTDDIKDNPINSSTDCQVIINNYKIALGNHPEITFWQQKKILRKHSVDFKKASYVIDENKAPIEFDYNMCEGNIYSTFFNSMVENVGTNVAKKSFLKDNLGNTAKNLYIFSLYSDIVKSNILLQNKQDEKLW